jgi:hypothetical protein
MAEGGPLECGKKWEGDKMTYFRCVKFENFETT